MRNILEITKYLGCIFLISFFIVSCKGSITEPNEIDKQNLMIVYPNNGKTIYLVDNQTFVLKKTINVDIAAEYDINRMCLSTNKDYYVFSVSLKNPPFTHYIASYNIENMKVASFFPTGLDSVGAPRITSAEMTSKPGLVYFYSHLNGLFSFDFTTKETLQIPYDYNFDVDVQFVKSPDTKWIVVNKSLPKANELEFYKTDFGLQNMQFVLNKSNKDGFYIYDLVFNKNNNDIFITYKIFKNSNNSTVGSFGRYDIETQQLLKSSLSFPFSLNPYYMEFSAIRNEAYLVGAYDTLYVVDTKNYLLKEKIILAGKAKGSSKLLIRNDDKVLFISCADSDCIIALDLDSRAILKKINLPIPYLLLEP